MDTSNTYGLHSRFQMKRPKRTRITLGGQLLTPVYGRVCYIPQQEYNTLVQTPNTEDGVCWQTKHAAVVRMGQHWVVLMRPFGIAGELPGTILLLPKPNGTN